MNIENHDSAISVQESTVVGVQELTAVDDQQSAEASDLQRLTVKGLTASERNQHSAISNPHSILPFIFLTVALLGGLRVSGEDHGFVFLPPPLITLVLAVLLMLLFVRGGLIELSSWISVDQSTLANIIHGWVLLTLFFASAQAFNSVLPESGLLHWLFSFFFLWTLWNNQFSSFDARRLLRSLAVLFGTAFVLKHLLLASLYSPEGSWLKRVTGALVSGITIGTLDAPTFAPATGYISFFTLGLYIVGLIVAGMDRGTGEQGNREQGKRGRGKGEERE